MLMQLVPEDQARGLKTPVWEEYKTIVNQVVLMFALPTPGKERCLARNAIVLVLYIVKLCCVYYV